MNESVEPMESEEALPEGNDDTPGTDDVDGAGSELDGGGRPLLERYRAALLASDPTIPAELVTGDSAEAIEASFAGARALVGRIREELATEAARPVPAGAPGRTRAAPKTAFEKIREGLGHKARLTPCGAAATLRRGG